MFCEILENKNQDINILTIDVEDWFHILDTPSTPPLSSWFNLESRIVANTLLILDLFRKYQIKCTFFVLGWVAENFPDLVREIDRQGHEIGTHGYSHELVYKLTPEQFYRDVNLSLEYLSRITSQPILGYRAPGFSITATSLWALDILIDLGFCYDSSIFPIKRNHGGFPKSSTEVCWLTTPKGKQIIEVPITPLSFLNQKVYLFGGGYFRLTPYQLITFAIKQINANNKPVMIYLHPREFDPNHPKLKLDFFRHFTCYINLKYTQNKLEKLLLDFKFSNIKNYLYSSTYISNSHVSLD
ncbi:XrtA system polysaccharide deacetylase [Chlorogloeopsis sp. ULAP02]|uniref:XrtA system polysaccharide deacetylase n=1 Tax=Chlorogloeopsis sp. ULAP02 TaxID=3107926 RepID=UPI0031359E67